MAKNEVKFDHCLSTLAMLGKIKHLQKTLKEKMPNIRRGKNFCQHSCQHQIWLYINYYLKTLWFVIETLFDSGLWMSVQIWYSFVCIDSFPLKGTATDDLVPAIKLYKHGQVYKSDRNGFINCGVGKVCIHKLIAVPCSFSEQLTEQC